MAIVKILAPITGSNRDTVVLATAFALAKAHNAHVEALFVYPDPREAVPITEMPMSPAIVQELVDTAEEMKENAAKAAKASLVDTADKAGARIISTPEKSDFVTVSYRPVMGHLPECIEDAAKFADLVVFPPLAHSDSPAVHDAFVLVLTKSERAIVLCAETPPESIGSNVAIGWDGGLAAAHALTAAIPILEKATKVELLEVGHFPADRQRVREAREYLALHGIEISVNAIERGQRAVGEVLLEAAVKNGCDLLIVGGYGHSRLRESIFGGVTLHLVSHPKIPILMVH